MAELTEKKPFLGRGRANALAHRGDREGHPPGNRRSAFDSAAALGFDHLESDVHATADGELVLFHDDRLDDETTGRGPIGDHSWAELESVRYISNGRVLGEGLLRLADALEQWPDVAWNIDAKSGGAVEPLLDLIDGFDAAERMLVTSFSYRTVRRLRRSAPERVASGMSQPEIAAARIASWLRLPVPRLGDAAQVPTAYGPFTIVDRRFVEACHRSGIEVHVWTINDADEMHRLFDLGVDAIITDDPATLKRVLIERGAWLPAGN